MDFGSVLYTAQKNDEYSRQSNGWYKTGFSPPKKEQREKKLSDNIKKFIARKEAEEKEKKLATELKKQELLTLRSMDKKSNKRVMSMLKLTKSANKSVLEDAVDQDNTAITAAGFVQPDDDDYGYVSKEAEALYYQYLKKHNTVPTEDPLKKKLSSKTPKDISTTKDRVKAALLREEEEKLQPRKRKRKIKESDPNQVSEAEDSDDGRTEKIDEQPKPEKFKIPKKNVQAPPPIDFQSLLKLAEKKQHEPILIQKPVEEKPERPMTQKEKQEYLRERERKMRREMSVTNNSNSNKLHESITKKLKPAEKPSPNSSVVSKSEIKVSQKDRSESTSSSIQKPIRTASTSLQKTKVISDVKKQPSAKVVRIDEKPKLQSDKPKSSQKLPSGDIKASAESKSCDKIDKSMLPTSTSNIDKKRAILMKKARERYLAEQRRIMNSTKPFLEREDQNRIKPSEKTVETLKNRDTRPSTDRKVITASNVKKTISQEKVREFPPRDTVRQFPPPDMIRKKRPAPQPVRRRIIESDDEYDSEMDDFIDDSEDPNDISKYITEIFGYDRSRYSRVEEEEDDDECMESNFADLEKEEYISLVTAVKEDLEDVRKTKLEKERKKKRMMSRY